MLSNNTGSTTLVQIPHQGKMISCKSVKNYLYFQRSVIVPYFFPIFILLPVLQKF